MKATTMLIAASFVALAGVAAMPSGAAVTQCSRGEFTQADQWAEGYATDCSGKLAAIASECHTEYPMDPTGLAQCIDGRTALNVIP